MKKTTALIILDGWGIGDEVPTNANYAADTPNFDRISAQYPKGQLKACGNAVGLPEGQMGNSEVGHMTIGAGRVVWMDLPKIDKAIESGELAKSARLNASFEKIKAAGGKLHVMGLASKGGVHAHQDHLLALAELGGAAGLEVIMHLFSDGRDVPPKSSAETLPPFLQQLAGIAKVGTISGRFYAMDRDHRWERIEPAYRAIAEGKGAHFQTVMEAVHAAYENGDTDEFIPPSVIGDYQGAANGDGFIFANFRSDRAREILSALGADEFSHFARKPIEWSDRLGMVGYSDDHDKYMGVIFPKDEIRATLGETVSRQGMRQFRIAETEKYPHVTFFMNGGREVPFDGEDRYLAPSPKVRTYDLQPEMSAAEVGRELEKAIRSGEYDLVICNFANPDMVGHTGDLEAAKAACAAVDAELGRAVAAIEELGGNMIVTADHGNCDVMVDPETGEPHTAHTLNPVQYVVIGHQGGVKAKAGLADLAPSLLALMGVEKPEEMEGICLLD